MRVLNPLNKKAADIPAAVRVKGNAETDYRTGDVNLTPENLGAMRFNDTPLYQYNGSEAKTLTDFDCGDAKLLLVYFDAAASELTSGLPAVIARQNGSQIVTQAADYNFRPNSTFSQTSQGRRSAQSSAETNNRWMVIRRIYKLA